MTKILKTVSRITHINKKNEFKAISIFLDLIPCDSTKNDKSCEAVAKMLTKLIHELNLDEYYSKFTFTSDNLISESIGKYMEAEGMKFKIRRLKVL